MLIIRDTSVVPPEGWSYIVESTGFTVRAPNWNAYYSMIVQHCQANGVAVPSEQDVIDYACRNLSVPCYESNTKEPLVNRFSLGLPAPVTSCCGSK